MNEAQKILAVAKQFNDTKRAMAFVSAGRSLAEYQKDLVSRSRSKASDTTQTNQNVSNPLVLASAVRGLITGQMSKEVKAFDSQFRSSGYKKSQQNSVILPLHSAFRNVGTINPASAGYLVGQETSDAYLKPFGDKLILDQLGAQSFYPNGSGEFKLPSMAKIEGVSTYKEEFGDGVNVELEIEPHSLKPKAIQVWTRISTEIEMQSDIDIENMVRNNFNKKILLSVQQEALKKYLATPGIEKIAINESDLNYKMINGLAGSILDELGDLGDDSFKYLTNYEVQGILETTLKSAGVSGYILGENGKIGAHDLLTTGAIRKTGDVVPVIVGDWNSAAFAFWRGYELTVKEGHFLNGDTLVRADVYFDTEIIRPEAFRILNVKIGV